MDIKWSWIVLLYYYYSYRFYADTNRIQIIWISVYDHSFFFMEYCLRASNPFIKMSFVEERVVRPTLLVNSELRLTTFTSNGASLFVKWTISS